MSRGEANDDWYAWQRHVLAPFKATVVRVTEPDTTNVPGTMNRDAQPGFILFHDGYDDRRVCPRPRHHRRRRGDRSARTGGWPGWKQRKLAGSTRACRRMGGPTVARGIENGRPTASDSGRSLCGGAGAVDSGPYRTARPTRLALDSGLAPPAGASAGVDREPGPGRRLSTRHEHRLKPDDRPLDIPPDCRA